jgi:hypothetical protein
LIKTRETLNTISSTQEGLTADTIVKTIDGYKNIKSLSTNDQIIGYATDTKQYYPTRVTAVTKQIAPNLIKITTNNDVIQAGAHQKFYLPEKKNWILAKDVKSGNYLCANSSNSMVINVESIDISTPLYTITVERSHFCITNSNILVHNFDPGTASTLLIFAPAANPAGITILGGAFLTSAICFTLYKIWEQEFSKRPHEQADYPIQPDKGIDLPGLILNQEPPYFAQEKEKKTKEHQPGDVHAEQSPDNKHEEHDVGGSSNQANDSDKNCENSDEKTEEDKNKPKNVEISKDDESHIFEDRPGHLTDTPENRKSLIGLASNIKNFLGFDKHGTEWYARLTENGNQLWAAVRNGIIRNGGMNEIPRTFNPETGLSRLIKPSK